MHREDKTLEEQDNDYRRLLIEIVAKVEFHYQDWICLQLEMPA